MKTQIWTKISISAVMLLGSVIAQASGSVIAGPDDAPVTINEYADFNCHYCQMGAGVMLQVLSDYAGKVRLVFHNIPMQNGSLLAAKAFLAVYMQSETLGYNYQKELFANPGKITSDSNYLYDLAAKLGADVARMKSDMTSEGITKSLAEDRQEFDAHGFHGTPSFVIGTESVEGARSYDYFKKIIDNQLNK